MMATYRVRFTIDDDAQFEECNGESRPLTEDEYRENVYRSCPQHPRAGTKVISFGPPQIQGCNVCGNTEYIDTPYDEYLAYYGNPERHVYLFAELEKQCECCQSWMPMESLGNIDLMDDDPGLNAIHLGQRYAIDSPKLKGYLAEVAREMLPESEAE